MNLLEFYNPILTLLRTGSEEDPLSQITQQSIIKDERVILDELPDFFSRLRIISNEQWTEKKDGYLGLNDYKIDYQMGVVFFHPDREGETVELQYFGRGVTFFPYDRIYWDFDGDLVTTLKDAAEQALLLLTQSESFRYKGDYSSVSTYFYRNLVNYHNGFYFCIDPSETGIIGVSPENFASWALVAKGINFRGYFNAADSYIPGDVVYYQGATYITLLANEGENPNTSYWERLSGWIWKGTFSLLDEYTIGDLVIKEEDNNDFYSLFMCIQKNTTGKSLNDGDYWTKIIDISNLAISLNEAEGLRVAAESIRVSNETNRQTAINNLIHLGNYDSNTTYSFRNIVEYQGSSFMAMQTTKGNLPTDTSYWNLLSSKGETGEQGEIGPQGIQGPPGEKGISFELTPPEDPEFNTLWLDISIVPNLLYRWDGEEWVEITESINYILEMISEIKEEIDETIEDTIVEIEGQIDSIYSLMQEDLNDALLDQMSQILGEISSLQDYLENLIEDERLATINEAIVSSIAYFTTKFGELLDNLSKFLRVIEGNSGFILGEEESSIGAYFQNDEIKVKRSGLTLLETKDNKIQVEEFETPSGKIASHKMWQQGDYTLIGWQG